MARSQQDLDGPRLTYGGPSGAPRRGRRRIAPAVVVLTVLGALLAVLVGVNVWRGVNTLKGLEAGASPAPTPASSVDSTGSPAPSPSQPSGGDATQGTRVPVGVSEASSRFVLGWLDRNPATRAATLKPVTVPELAAALGRVDPAKVPSADPVGAPRPQAVSDYSATMVQSLSDNTTIVLDLAADPEATYGWMVYRVSPGGRDGG